jgi:hypothetical protein
MPDNGWVMPYEHFGYYNGFSDSIPVLVSGERSKDWIFCHDCVVKFFNAFPLLAAEFGRGHHPCDDDVPCCQFAWRGTEFFGKRNETPQVCVQYATPELTWVDGDPEL